MPDKHELGLYLTFVSSTRLGVLLHVYVIQGKAINRVTCHSDIWTWSPPTRGPQSRWVRPLEKRTVPSLSSKMVQSTKLQTEEGKERMRRL